MNRLTKLLRNRSEEEKLLSIFLTAGYPKKESTAEIVRVVESAGADFVEIGVPFSDPMADGPTIQKSSEIALQNGINLDLVLEQIQRIRTESQLPFILMSYLNPILAYGTERLIEDATAAGVDGFIIPDLIPEEKRRICGDGGEMDVNFLISPNTAQDRVEAIDEATADFIYCVSVAGVTGARKGIPSDLIDFLKSIRRKVSSPVFVGFGISNGKDAREIARNCSGVIVGSAIINLLAGSNGQGKGLQSVAEFVRDLKSALKGD